MQMGELKDAFERNNINPNGGWTTKMLKDIDKEVPRVEPTQTLLQQNDMQQVAVQNYDPAPSSEAVSKERMEQLLANVTTSTVNELRELRDEIDNLIRTVQARHTTLINACNQHIDYATSTINCKEVVKDSLNRIVNNFKNGDDPVPKTVTVEKQ